MAKHWYCSFIGGTIEAQWEVLLPPSAMCSEVIWFFITVIKIPKRMILEGYIYWEYRGCGQSHQEGNKGGRQGSLPYGGQKKKKKELKELGKMDIQGYTQVYLLLPKWPQLDLPAHLRNDIISITSYEKINISFRSEPLWSCCLWKGHHEHQRHAFP